MRLLRENMQRQLKVFDDENNILTSPITGIWPPTTLDAVFDQEHPTLRTLRQIIADLRQEIITGGIGNIVFPVTSVNGQSAATGQGDVLLRAASVGLGFVDNTRDMDKPMSIPQARRVQEMLEQFDWQAGNVNLQQLYDHLMDRDNPHVVTFDQINVGGLFENLINSMITIHSLNTTNFTHPDIRRSISQMWNRIETMDQALEDRIGRVLQDLCDHLGDDNAHFSLFDLKEDKANKTTYFNEDIDNSHMHYPTTRAVMDHTKNSLISFREELANDKQFAEWLADVRVANRVTDLPPANVNSWRQVYVIRNAAREPGNPANYMAISVCRRRENGTFFWDTHNTGAITTLHPHHFIDDPTGVRLNMTAIIDAVALGGDPDSVGSALDNFFTKEESLRHFIQNITILPGTMDGYIRYYFNNDQLVSIDELAADWSVNLPSSPFTLHTVLTGPINLVNSIGIRIQSRQRGSDADRMFNFDILNITVTNNGGVQVFNLLQYLNENQHIGDFDEHGVWHDDITKIPGIGVNGAFTNIVRPTSGDPFIRVSRRFAEWDGVDLLESHFGFMTGFVITVTGRVTTAAGSNGMILNGRTRYWNEVRIPGLRNLAFKEWITETEIIDDAVHNRHILNKAIEARNIGDREVKARGPHHPHIACEYGRMIGNILNEDVDEAHEVSLIQLADYLRPLIGGWPDPGVPGGNPWVDWVRDMILSPHHYEPGVEYDLRDQSYAMRFTGHISCIPNMNLDLILSDVIRGSTHRLLDAGGNWQISTNVNGGEFSILGGTNLTGHTFGTIIMDRYHLRFVSISVGDRMEAPYDIWVRYTKDPNTDIPPGPGPGPDPADPPPDLTLSTNVIHLNDGSLTAHVDLGGTVGGAVFVDRLTLADEIEVFVMGDRVTFVANRPWQQHQPIIGSTMVVITRGGINRVVSVNTNLTPLNIPLAFNVVPQIVVINDHQKVGTFMIVGSNTGPVTVDRMGMPPSISTEIEVPTFGPGDPGDFQNANGVVIVRAIRPVHGEPAINGIFPLRIMRDGMVRVVVVQVNLTPIPLVTLLSEANMFISNTNLTSSITVGGTTTGLITANTTYTLPSNISLSINQSNNIISVVADRPAVGQPPIDQEFVVTVVRGGRSATFRIHAELTPWPPPTP